MSYIRRKLESDVQRASKCLEIGVSKGGNVSKECMINSLPLGTVNAEMVTEEQLEMEEAVETEEIVQLARSSSSPVGIADTKASTAAVKTNWRKAWLNMMTRTRNV